MVTCAMNAPTACWMTQAEAADRLKVTLAMVVDAATRLQWPSRLRDDQVVEIEVPGMVLLEAQARPDLRPSNERPVDARAIEVGVKAAIQPLHQTMEELVEALWASRAATEAVHGERTAANAATAKAREETAGATARAVRAAASSLKEELRREDLETEIRGLRREIAVLKERKRRWWWPG
jgi:hypothetical protein